MPILYINTGTAPNQGNGDSLRLAFNKINSNFELLSDTSFATDSIGAVIDNPELQRGIVVTYNPNNQKASFLVNIASADTLGAIRIGSGITLNPDTGIISVFDGNYNNLTNIPQGISTIDSPIFSNLSITNQLSVAGSTTVINSTAIETANLTITLSKDAESDLAANGAGIIINGAEIPASLTYAASDDSWNFNKKVNALSLHVNGARVSSAADFGDIRFSTNVISTVNEDQDVVIDPNGSGRVRLVNSALQFDNGINAAYTDHLLYSAPNSGKVGLGIGNDNNSLRIVGDGATPGIVADFGTYVDGTGDWTSNLTVNSDGSLKVNGTIYQGVAYNGIEYTDTAIRVDADVDNFAQMIMQNHSTGTNASTDFVLMNDQGDNFSNIIDLGINSSNYSVAQYSVTQPGDGYLFVNGGNLTIGTQTPDKKIVFHAGGTTIDDSTAYFDQNVWQFNRPVTIDVNRPVPLNFTVINRSSNVVAQSLFQAVNNLGNLVHFGINSSHPEAFYGRIGPNEAFLHVENTTSTLHLGGYGDTVFYSDQANGFAGTPTLVMSSINQSSTFNGHVLPNETLSYDLGSVDNQWRSLYVSSSTIYIGENELNIDETGTLRINGDEIQGDSYTPAEVLHWNTPSVNNMSAALDELAARVTALQNFEIDGGNAYTPDAGELLIDGNGA